jgi:hypothetical protein
MLKQVSAFPLEGHGSFGIDRVGISCYLDGHRWRSRKVRLLREARERLQAQGAIKRLDGRLVAQLTPAFTISLGHEPGADGSCTGFLKSNVMRRVRSRLVDEGRYPSVVKVPGARDDNFIEPGKLAGDADVHAEALAELRSLLDEARAQYQEALRLFDVLASPHDIRVSIATIELCWDVQSKLALAASTLWWPAWRDAHRGAAIGVGQSGKKDILRARRTEATERREGDAMIGTGVLRADAAHGGGLKLYAKHDHLLRFEAEFTNDRISKLIGRRIRVGDPQHMADDLAQLGRGAYRRLLDAQSNLSCDRVLSVGELIAAFMPDEEGKKIQCLVEAFEAGQKFHHTGRTHERPLARLKRRGFVAYRGAGTWAPTAELHATFKLLQFLRTRTQGPA